MGLITEKVEIKWNSNNKSFYINKGYVFTHMGDKFIINVHDLSNSATIKVIVKCDNCDKERLIGWGEYRKQIIKHNKSLCLKCSNMIITSKSMRLTKLNKSISLKQWCEENNRLDILERYDYDLNEIDINQISYKSNKFIWLKCPQLIHKSEYKKVCDITKRNSLVECIQCNSFGQWLINHYSHDIIDLIWSSKNEISPYDISYGSSKKVWINCLECNFEKFVTPYEYTHNKFSCPKCSDGISYPNKIAFNLLIQTGIKFIPEYSPDWIKPKRYDFYFELNNQKYIVEMHRKWHNKDNTLNGKTREESKLLDDYKDDIAIKHNIKLIRINCDKSDLDFIKYNILNSELNNIINMSNIDWIECNKFANKSMVKTACNLWNKGINNTLQISKILNISRTTVNKYMHIGVINNWCNYDGLNEKNKSYTNRSNKVYCVELDRIFLSVKEAEKILNIHNYNIARCCKNNLKNYSAGKLPDGTKLHWMYYEDYIKHNKVS